MVPIFCQLSIRSAATISIHDKSKSYILEANTLSGKQIAGHVGISSKEIAEQCTLNQGDHFCMNTHELR